MKQVFVNGWWPGFLERTDGVHVGFFQELLKGAFETDIHVTTNLEEADILLESFFQPSVFHRREWPISIFFSGEGTVPLPSHIQEYSCVLGAQKVGRFVSCPLFLAYCYSKPATYPATITTVPTKPLCSIISSPTNRTITTARIQLIEFLKQASVPIHFGGSYQNNIGYKVPGQYYQQPIIDFQKQYRLVCAFENCCLDDYITEKVINPLRAGTVPLYLGSNKIDSYINEDRIVRVDPHNFGACLDEVRRLLTDDAYWLEKVNRPIFKKSLEEIIKETAVSICHILFHSSQ
jgi:hypothetical protein